MGSLQLPTIDFSNIHQGTIFWDSTKLQVLEAFQEYGCFEATFDGISPDLRNSMFSLLNHLFDLPLEIKLKNTADKIFNGYLGQNKEVPLYESLGMEDPEIFTKLMWPNGNPEFCSSIQIYFQKMKELDQIVRLMVLESLNLKEYLDEYIDLNSYLLRVMKYRVPEKDESNFGLHGHVDKNMVTILHQNEVGGLEVQNKDEEWIKTKVSSNCFVVMAGETLNVWTNGRIRAAIHRVVMNRDEARFSIGLFTAPKWGKIVKVPEEMVDEEHPLLFKPFDYGEFTKFFCEEENKREKFVLKKYCGVSC